MTSALLPQQPALRPRSTVPRADRLDSLTGLRFLAALAVFTHHFTGASPAGGVAHTPALFPYSTMGVNGVGFFFVLSGFLLAWGHRSGTPARTFYWRRAGRVLPLHLAATIPCIWVFHLWGGVPWDLPSFLASLVLVQTWFPGVVPMFPGNGVSWTLSVEAFFYLLFPFVIRGAYRLRTRTLFALCAAGLLAMWGVGFWAATHLSPFLAEWVMRLPVARLPEFALGTSLALAVGRGLRIPVRPGPLTAAFAAYTIVYAHRGDWFGPGVVQQLDCSVRPLVALFSGLLIVACVRRERDGVRGWLCGPVMVRLGAWSYAFYLLHQTVNRFVLDHWGRAAPGDQNVLTLIGVATLVVGLSWAAYTYVEEPARRWWYRRQPT